jgi:hypothetical protein
MQSAYKVAFDVIHAEPPEIAGPLLVGLSVFIVGVVAMIGSRYPRNRVVLAGGIILALFGATLSSGFINSRWQFNSFVDDYRAGRCAIIEGEVQNFHPMPFSGHGLESFEVAGHKFSYSDFRITPGFHQTRSHGGPIRPGIKVRVCYLGNDIARLEIANAENQAFD